jgi:hypothetical protein
MWRDFLRGGKNLVCAMCALTLKLQMPERNILLPSEAVSKIKGSGSEKEL